MNTHAHPRDPEALSPSNEATETVPLSENTSDLNVDGMDEVEGMVAEIAKDKTSENKSDGHRKGTPTQSSQKKDDFTKDERLALRERLLKNAPREMAMRAQILNELEKKRVQLEVDIRGYHRRKEYHLLSAAIAQLRAVIHQLEIVAKAGYEVLRELWLKVVHKFA